jgi:hypothetical protein
VARLSFETRHWLLSAPSLLYPRPIPLRVCAYIVLPPHLVFPCFSEPFRLGPWQRWRLSQKPPTGSAELVRGAARAIPFDPMTLPETKPTHAGLQTVHRMLSPARASCGATLEGRSCISNLPQLSYNALATFRPLVKIMLLHSSTVQNTQHPSKRQSGSGVHTISAQKIST